MAARDAAVAAFARRFLDISLSYGQLHTLMLWGMVDRYSWLQENTPRTDKAAKRPCPYDADYRAKPTAGGDRRVAGGCAGSAELGFPIPAPSPGPVSVELPG